jgi:hypothetical protein
LVFNKPLPHARRERDLRRGGEHFLLQMGPLFASVPSEK